MSGSYRMHPAGAQSSFNIEDTHSHTDISGFFDFSNSDLHASVPGAANCDTYRGEYEAVATMSEIPDLHLRLEPTVNALDFLRTFQKTNQNQDNSLRFACAGAELALSRCLFGLLLLLIIHTSHNLLRRRCDSGPSLCCFARHGTLDVRTDNLATVVGH